MGLQASKYKINTTKWSTFLQKNILYQCDADGTVLILILRFGIYNVACIHTWYDNISVLILFVVLDKQSVKFLVCNLVLVTNFGIRNTDIKCSIDCLDGLIFLK